MNTRITMTAIALSMMALAGCSNPLSGKDQMTAPAAKAAPAATGEAITKEAMIKEGAELAKDAMIKEGDAMVKDAMVKEGDAMVKEGDAMVKDAMVKEGDALSADDAAINACFQAGGQVVSWIGDPTGGEQACRREDGLEYRLADAQYYQ